jgi:hypothetical protein
MKTAECFNTIEELNTQLLNKNDSILSYYKDCYNIIRLKDIEDEEEAGLKWRKYQINKGSKAIFEVETSPLSINTIKRITILDGSLKYRDMVFVGQSFINFKSIMNYGYWDEAFGIFFLKEDKKNNVSIILSPNKETEFKSWEQDINKIPDDIKVSSIIITSLQ